MIVGLTGGIATGKSTVSTILKSFGAFVVDADVWARRVVEPGSNGLKEIVESFGENIVDANGYLDRKALGKLIFSNADLRNKLNRITHPRIQYGMKAETAAYLEAHPGESVVWDVPLLFEGDLHRMVDCTVLVYTPSHIQLMRLMARDGMDKPSARARIDAQMPIDEKRKLATYLIDNSDGLETTREQVQQIWTTIRSQASTGRA